MFKRWEIKIVKLYEENINKVKEKVKKGRQDK